jgi:hypothetical protein
VVSNKGSTFLWYYLPDMGFMVATLAVEIAAAAD